MITSREQSVCIKFGFKLGKTAYETHDVLWTASSENILSKV